MSDQRKSSYLGIPRCCLLTMLACSALLLTGCFEVDALWNLGADGTIRSQVVLRIDKFFLGENRSSDESELDCETRITNILEEKGHSIQLFLGLFDINDNLDYAHLLRWEDTPKECVVTAVFEYSSVYVADQIEDTEIDGITITRTEDINRFQFPRQSTDILADYILDEYTNINRLKLHDAKISMNVNLPGRIKTNTRSDNHILEDVAVGLSNTYHKTTSDIRKSTKITGFIWEYEGYHGIIKFFMEDKDAYTITVDAVFRVTDSILGKIFFISLFILLFIFFIIALIQGYHTVLG